MTYWELSEQFHQDEVDLYQYGYRDDLNAGLLSLTQDGSLACVVQTDDDDTHLLLSQETLEELGENKTHIF